MVSRYRWRLIAASGCIVVFIVIICLPSAQRNWFIPFPVRVSIAEVYANPTQYANRLVEIHGIFQAIDGNACGGPTVTNVVLSDNSLSTLPPEAVPSSVITMNRDQYSSDINRYIDSQAYTNKPIIIWGRIEYIKVESVEHVECPDSSSGSSLTPRDLLRLNSIWYIWNKDSN